MQNRLHPQTSRAEVKTTTSHGAGAPSMSASSSSSYIDISNRINLNTFVEEVNFLSRTRIIGIRITDSNPEVRGFYNVIIYSLQKRNLLIRSIKEPEIYKLAILGPISSVTLDLQFDQSSKYSQQDLENAIRDETIVFHRLRALMQVDRGFVEHIKQYFPSVHTAYTIKAAEFKEADIAHLHSLDPTKVAANTLIF